MKKVVCVNDKNLPSGATLSEGREYEVIDEYINPYEQRVYIIKGINNTGTTKFGMVWRGYNADRFADLTSIEQEERVFDFALN